MRYLYLLFFCFLSLHSYLVFAQDSPAPVCTNSVSYGCSTNPSAVGFNANACYTGSYLNPSFRVVDTKCGSYPGKNTFCDYNCSCPPGFTLNVRISPVTGQNQTECVPDEPAPEQCPDGSTKPLEGPCPAACPSGKPRVNGECLICPEYNSDGTCANPSSQPASSAPNSSSPDTGSSGSAGSAGSAGGGGDDGGGSPGGGDGGPGNGGDNGGGGSAASASSASGAAASSGTNNSWNPYSGYGNWIPIAPDSPCPNKYQDVSGQWWCAGNGLGASSGGSASSAGSNGSNSSGSAGSNSSGSSTSSSCPAKPVCKKNTGIDADDQNCKKLLQEYFSACPGNPTENGLFDIDKDELGEGRPLTFKNSLEDFKTSLSELENVQAIDEFFSFEGSGTCPVWQVQVLVFNVVIDQQCSPNIPWGLIRGIIIAVAVLLAARISLH